MAKFRALVVDDASFVRDLVKKTLRDTIPVIESHDAINGKKAQTLMKNGKFDLILCDWEMPEMSGLELLSWARSTEAYKKTPFIMITSRGDRSHVVEAVQSGVSEYLGKPFSAEQLVGKIFKVFGKRLKSVGMADPSETPKDAFAQSAALLTKTASPKEKAPPLNQSAQVLTGGGSVKPSTQCSPKEKTFASLRFSGGSVNTMVKFVSATEIRLVTRLESVFPKILTPVVVDIELVKDQMARLNGYVHQLQALEKKQDTEFVSIIVQLVDDDPQKLDQLKAFIEHNI